MTIDNGVSGVLIDNIQVPLSFADQAGNSVRGTSDPNDLTAAFYFRLQTGSAVPASIAGGTSATMAWLIIPSKGSGGQDPRGALYYIGASLSYRVAGQNQAVTVTPVSIYVKPMPGLSLDYFLPAEVYGDDPFTDFFELAVPYNLGVRVANTGYGYSRALKIDSGRFVGGF